MAARRAARGQEARAPKKGLRGREIAHEVLAKKLRRAVMARIARDQDAGELEELALSLTSLILGPRG